jgi:predicted nucleotidyltransferase
MVYCSGLPPPNIRTTRPFPASKTLPTLAQLKPAVLRITRKYGVKNVRIFGSYARGEQRPTSDIDLLVDLPKNMSLLDLVGLKLDLEEELKRKVDVVPSDSVKPTLRPYILADARRL